MGAAIAAALRFIIMAAVQLGLWSLVEKYGIPMLNTAIKEIAMMNGSTEEEAKDLVANHTLRAFEEVGIFALTLKSKLPIRVAEFLGFTSKGFAYRKLSPKLQKFFTSTKVVTAVKVAATTPEIEKIAETVALTRGLDKLKVVVLWTAIFTAIQATTNIASTVGNWIDFANWNGTYQKNFQKLFAKFGFVADAPLPKSNTISEDAWKRIYSTVEELNPQTIAFPWLDTVKPYSRQNLVDAVDHFAANLAAENISPTYKNVWTLLLPCIKVPLGTYDDKPTTTASKPVSQATSAPKIQVFTGVVSQGVLGNGTVFQPRSNDMIDDVDELIDSCSINLASFLTSLTSRVTYEIKIVSSITTKDGFTQRGSTTQVQTGTYANGAPKYKTVTNKFAVLYLYLLTDKGTRTKLATVNVGPVNSVNFQPNSNDLNAVAGRLQSIVTTTNTSAIQQIVSDTPVTVTPATPELAPLPKYNNSQKIPNDLGFAFYKRDNPSPQPPSYVVVPDYKFYDMTYGRIDEEQYRRETGDTKDYTNSGYQLVNGVFTQVNNIIPTTTLGTTATGSATTAPPAERMGANALTLNEWYIANGQLLPTIQARSLIYEQYGLGAAALYIGSAEQNIRLLAKLKGL